MRYSDGGKEPRIAAILLCAGRGTRTGLPYNKILLNIGSKSVLETALDAFCSTGLFDEILVAAAPDEFDLVMETAIEKGAKVCVGGETRTDSIRRALRGLSPDTDIVLIHDGARPFVTPDVIERVIDSAAKYGSGIAAVPVVDAVKVSEDGVVSDDLPKASLFNAQTPQGFRYAEITDAYARVPGSYGDDCEVYRRAGYSPRLVAGNYANRKITTQADIFNLSRAYRIGYGYDVHQLVEGRDLIVGGIYIPFEKGLLGHSDADVLTHAVMDALLSAAGYPDIGVIFPDTDDRYKGCSSMVMLAHVKDMLEARHARVLGISGVIMAQRPKMAGHIPDMIATIARTLGISPTLVNISATTTEKLGIVGEGRGMAASACALVGT